MTIGFRQRDPSGNILVDITTRLPRIMGRVNISAGVAGSVSVPVSGSNDIFFCFYPSGSGDFLASPVFTISSNNISWNFPTGSRFSSAGQLSYGRY